MFNKEKSNLLSGDLQRFNEIEHLFILLKRAETYLLLTNEYSDEFKDIHNELISIQYKVHLKAEQFIKENTPLYEGIKK